MSQLIEMGKQYTSNGKPARILCVDAGGSHPVVALIGDQIERFTSDGHYNLGRCDKGGDLIEVKPRIVAGVWCNIYSERGIISIGGSHPTKDMAKQARSSGCIACVPVTIDCEEGEGL